MKIIAMEKEIPGVRPDEFAQHLKSEARQVWKLYQEGCIREFYFCEERSEAVLILECGDRDEAKQALDSLPLVQAGLITFEIIPLLPYPGFSRLFVEN